MWPSPAFRISHPLRGRNELFSTGIRLRRDHNDRAIMRRPSAFSFILACGLWAALTLAQTKPALLAVPKAGPQALAERKIKQKHAKEYAQKDGPSRLALAHTLRAGAKEPKANPRADDDEPTRYVMLREARELSVDAG